MTMVCGLDLHRRQITFDALEVESGQVWTGRLWQPDRARFRRWLRDDVTERAAGGFLSRQGPQTLRWALYEAAKNASHQRSPDHDYYTDVMEHLNGTLATISMARKIARRCFHVLRAVDPDLAFAMP